MTARQAAVCTLLKASENRGYSNIELDAAIKKYELDGAERAFFTALFYGVIERKITLDYIISALSSRRIENIDITVLTIIETGLYQLRFMDKVPASAAANESVKLCEVCRAPKNSGAYVNAVLREYIRRGENIAFPDKEREPIKYLSVAYSMPEHICALWRERYGGECEKLLSSLFSAPKMTLRANTLKIPAEELVLRLSSLKIKARRTKYAPHGVNLLQTAPMSALSDISELFFVQDEASQTAVLALGAKAGDTVIDVCACPGGKSLGAAMDMNDAGEIFAFDLRQSKLRLIEKSAARLGISIIRTAVSDGRRHHEDMPSADKIICDVPCSGLGVIAKKPDVRYKSAEEIEKLPSCQAKILEASSSYLRPGGDMVYSTCTLNPAENEDVVNVFLAKHKEFSLSPFEAGELRSHGMLTLFPHIHCTDGFFIAKLHKSKDT